MGPPDQEEMEVDSDPGSEPVGLDDDWNDIEVGVGAEADNRKTRRGRMRDPENSVLEADLESRPLIPCPVPDCIAQLSRRDHLRRHISKVHLEDPEKYLEPQRKSGEGIPCPVENCGAVISNRSHLLRHVRSVHKLDPEEVLPPPKRKSGNLQNKTTEYHCPVEGCDVVLCRKDGLLRHMRNKHGMDVKGQALPSGSKVGEGDLESGEYAVGPQMDISGPPGKIEGAELELCFLCCSSLGVTHSKDNPELSKFLRQVLKDQMGSSVNPGIFEGAALKNLKVCDKCGERVGGALQRKGRVDRTEMEVRKLQSLLLEEMRKLQKRLGDYWTELRGMEELIKGTSQNVLEAYLGENAKRGRTEENSLALTVREAIGMVASKLEEFNKEIKVHGGAKRILKRRRKPAPKRVQKQKAPAAPPILSALELGSAVVKTERLSDSEQIQEEMDDDYSGFSAPSSPPEEPKAIRQSHRLKRDAALVAPKPEAGQSEPLQGPPDNLEIEEDADDDVDYNPGSDDDDWHAETLNLDSSEESSSDLVGSDSDSESGSDAEYNPCRSKSGSRTDKVKVPKEKKMNTGTATAKEGASRRSKYAQKKLKDAGAPAVDTSKWSEFKRRLFRETYRRLNLRQKVLAKRQSDPQHVPDPRLEHCTEYHPETDTFSLGGVQIILHEASETLECSQCGFPVSYSASVRRQVGSLMQMHIQSKHLTIFRCHLCDSVLGSYKRYRDHIEGHQGRYFCDECGKTLYSEESLRAHRWYKHMTPQQIAEALERGERDPRKKRPPPGSLPKFQCVTCGKSFTQSGALKLHEKLKHSEHPIERLVCSNCGGTFNLKGNLEYHQKYSCFLPGQAPPPPVPCEEEQCGRTFKNKRMMKRHMKECHSQFAVDKPFRCDQCGAGFPTNARLIRHQVSHSDARPYSCRLGCGATYKTAKHRTRHEKLCRVQGGNSSGVGVARKREVKREIQFF